MAFNNNYNNYSNNNGRYNDRNRSNYGGGGGQNRYQSRGSAPLKDYAPATVPEAYVDEAEAVMKAIYELKKGDQITTSKLRNLFTLITDIFNVEQLRSEPTLDSKSVAKLQMMRIRVLYEAGREDSTKKFVEQAKLIEYLKGIGTSRDDLIRFAHYMEALVAYHRFYRIGNER